MIKVYGASDDLIEIEGDIREEFNINYEKTGYLVFSNGVVLTVQYDEMGIWRIECIANSAFADITKCQSDGSGDDYSDIAEIADDTFGQKIQWVLFSNEVEFVRKDK